jgi:hypothetical protein
MVAQANDGRMWRVRIPSPLILIYTNCLFTKLFIYGIINISTE